MNRLKVLGCLIFLFGFVFGNQLSQHLFLKQQSVFMTDWRNEIVRASKVVLLNNEDISSVTTPDTIQMQKSPSHASRVTFGKIVLESLGAAAGGTVIGLLCYKTTKDIIFWRGLITFTGVSFGLAGGTTLVGNLLMEPDGSFTKSLLGSFIGTGLGAGVLFLTSLAYLGWEAGRSEGGPPVALIGISLASALPISGAVMGYNLKDSGCCLLGSAEKQYVEHELSNPPKALLKMQIVSMKF